MTFSPSTPSNPSDSDTQIIQPGTLKVIKRTGQIAGYDESKIFNAIFSAFLDEEGESIRQSQATDDKIRTLVSSITSTFKRRMPSGGALGIEEIQDQVELVLMRAADHRVARSYVLYREQRAQARESAQPQAYNKTFEPIYVTEPDGSQSLLDPQQLMTAALMASAGLADVDAQEIFNDAIRNLYSGIKRSDVEQAAIMASRALVDQEPNYSFATARLLNLSVHREVCSRLEMDTDQPLEELLKDSPALKTLYASILPKYLQTGIELGYLDPSLKKYDLVALADALAPERDRQFTYLGLQTLFDRYLLQDQQQVRYELPQIFFLRVAMGLALQEEHFNERAIEYYHKLSSFDYLSSTPTLFNAATTRPQLSSCYLTTVPDDLGEIFHSIRDNALLSKWAGGLGNDWTQVRAHDSHIKGTNGRSQGVVPFLKIVNDTAVAVNQGGKRKGAVCCYLETWHLDIEEFLELRKNTGDDRRRTHDMHTANWIPDLFMKRVVENGVWTLFSPTDVPDLHDLIGQEFEQRYTAYENMVAEGKIQSAKQIQAVALWQRMLTMLFETGNPWMTFKDACNLRSPQQHVGRVHSSNLCTEITLNTSDDEIAVCNLGSVNLANHIKDGRLDTDLLQSTVRTAVRMLDNVIDINYYAVDKAKNSNLKHRPIGLGLMGFHDALYQLGIPYGSEAAVEFADRSMEHISYAAIETSSDLAAERGCYSSYQGSLWSQGILPIDSLEILKRERGEQYLSIDSSQTLDWDRLRTKIKRQGMRNSNVLAIAPTATIANIVGVSQSIDPTYQNLYSKSNLSGEFTVINRYLVQQLKELNLWDDAMRADLKHYDGSLKSIQRIPESLRELFATAFETPVQWPLKAAARRQKWIDQAQSLNIYMQGTDGEKLSRAYINCWKMGLKTTYYLRTLGATSIEKASADISSNQLNAVVATQAPSACSLDDPDCEACQ
ncbi:MAG: ribonucleoside-diphosphate reductase subunit alpha [Gammaproteobacteria bacterium]